MFNFGKDKDDKGEETAEQRMAKNIANLSNQIGALQQQLVERNKQVEDLTKQLGAAKSGQQDAATAQEALRRAKVEAKDAQDQMHILERQVEEMREQATRSAADAKSSATPAASSGVEAPGKSGVQSGAQSGVGGGVGGGLQSGAGVLSVGASAPSQPAAPATAGGLAVGGTAYVRNVGGKTLRRRSAPGLESKILDGLQPGTQLTLQSGPIDEDNYSWWFIRTEDGREGWVAGEELVTQPD